MTALNAGSPGTKASLTSTSSDDTDSGLVGGTGLSGTQLPSALHRLAALHSLILSVGAVPDLVLQLSRLLQLLAASLSLDDRISVGACQKSDRAPGTTSLSYPVVLHTHVLCSVLLFDFLHPCVLPCVEFATLHSVQGGRCCAGSLDIMAAPCSYVLAVLSGAPRLLTAVPGRALSTFVDPAGPVLPQVCLLVLRQTAYCNTSAE